MDAVLQRKIIAQVGLQHRSELITNGPPDDNPKRRSRGRE